ncbi:MAG: diadenylate cyclase CdaA [Chthoniobacteraceae bacterium]
MSWSTFLPTDWRGALEVAILWAGLYGAWRSLRGTRGARVLTGLVSVLFAMMLVSGFFDLPVLGWVFRNLSTALLFMFIVIFQPEIRRALAALGTHQLFARAAGTTEFVEQITEATFELANRQLGALIALERDINLAPFGESGQEIDCKLSPALLTTIFFHKTPLHDGGVIIRGDRLLFASCTFPVIQRPDLDRTFGMRHRAALGLSDESDAIVVVVSEETGVVSICHHGKLERNFDPESFRRRLSELLLLDKNEKTTPADHKTLAGKTADAPARPAAVGRGAQEPRSDRLAF